MTGIQIRAAVRDDLPRLTEIYNYFVVHTPVTFDLEPWTVERRAAWFEQFGAGGGIGCWLLWRAMWLPATRGRRGFA